MADTLVVNASPVIVLTKIARLDLLHRLFDNVILPDAVAAELMAGPAEDPARLIVSGGWGTRQSPRSVFPSLMERGLGAGETAVIAISLENMPCTAMLDDAAARIAARTLGIKTIGTLGLIIRAKRTGHIASAAAVMKELRDVGLYLHDAVIRDALAATGEAWPT